MRITALSSLLLLTAFSCHAGIFDLRLSDEHNRPFALSELVKYKAVVFIFLSPECPLSRNYTRTINNLCASMDTSKTAVYSIVAGKDFSHKQLLEFAGKYQLLSPLLRDKHYELAREIGASVTPEAFLIDPGTKRIVYRGAIDNWPVSLGKQRHQITEHYLLDALQQYLSGEKVEVSQINAIGCFLEIK